MLLSAALAVFLSPPTAPEDPVTLKGKAEAFSRIPQAQMSKLSPKHAVGEQLTFGGSEFPVLVTGNKLRVATKPGGPASTTAKEGKPVSLAWTQDGERRKLSVGFEQDAAGAWQFYVASSYRFKLCGQSIALVDCNGDGLFNGFGVDGYCYGESTAICPLTAELVIGTSVVKFQEIAPDGSTMTFSWAAIEGNEQQLACLLALNELRALNGLSQVRLDPEWSRGCTEHAEYLVRIGWDGKTSPNIGGLEEQGESAECAYSAKKSEVTENPPDLTIRNGWRGYYRRVRSMRPELERIGVNASPLHLAVINLSGVELPRGASIEGWDEPIVVPASGSVDFPCKALQNLTTEPVTDFMSRGAPILIHFPDDSKPVTEFSGKLRKLKGKRNQDVPVLYGAPTEDWILFGLVPVEPLEAGAWYEAELHYVVDGQSHVRTTVFQTE